MLEISGGGEAHMEYRYRFTFERKMALYICVHLAHMRFTSALNELVRFIMDNSGQRVEYVPPKADAIRAFARSVCATLAERGNDSIYNEPYVIRGLAEFLEIALKVQAKYLNTRQLIDSEDK